MIRLAKPDLGAEEIGASTEVLRSGFLVQGPRVAAFEQALSDRLDGVPVVAVNSATSALHVALLALGVGPGDRVAVAAFSFPATANVIALCGARPVFIDIETRTFGMDPEALAHAIARDPGIKVVMPVHVFGAMADMGAIRAAAGGRPIVEDAACALDASVGGTKAGLWGDVGCFSFHPRKAITTGEGGALVARDSALIRRAKALRNHGQDPDAAAPDFVVPGFNYRLTEMQAAIGCAQLRRATHIVETRRALAQAYNRKLLSAGLVLPEEREPGAHVYQTYAVLLPSQLAERRATIIAELRAGGVEATIGTYHIPLLSYYRSTYGHRVAEFPVSEDVARRALALPLHTHLTERDLDVVVQRLRELL